MTEEAGNVEAEDEDAAFTRARRAERIREVGAMKGRCYIDASRHMRWVAYSFAWIRYETEGWDEPHCEAFSRGLDDTARPAAASSFVWYRVSLPENVSEQGRQWSKSTLISNCYRLIGY